MKRVLEVDDVDKAQLLRLLHGEVPPEKASALRERLVREPELAAAWRRLESAWERLAPPPPAPVPLGFSGRVMARVREQAAGAPPRGTAAGAAITWAAAPTWVRATCAAALVAGVLLGAGLGSRGRLDERQRTADSVPALTESYWALVDTPSETAAAPPALPSPRGEARR
jgi:negative regulator of sigma E activity